MSKESAIRVLYSVKEKNDNLVGSLIILNNLLID